MTRRVLPSFWGSSWLKILVLVVLALIAYQRIWHLGYIWDDDFYVTHNSTLRDLSGLWRIWFDLTSTPQYYPLVHSSFLVEYHLWGLNSVGYHAVNLTLHILAALLLWRVLVELRVPGAWLAAAIFAVHPVEVESVAWITERKNVLSAVFYLAAALAYLRFERKRADNKSDREGRARLVLVKKRVRLLYTASFVLFIFALLSKTVACSLPAALLLVRWWQTGTLRRRDLVPLLPFFAVGLGFGVATAWIEQHHVGAEGAAWSLNFAQRILIAGRALWFYAAKLVWPTRLTFIYPRWGTNALALWQWLFPLGVVALIAALWFLRTRLGRGPLVAVLFFAGTLLPALGFVNVFPLRYSFVADHFQYLASIGLIALAAAGLIRLPVVAPAVLLILLGLLTWKQTVIYQNLETLWLDTIQKNPGSSMAQTNYGMVLLEEGKGDEALPHLQQALALEPNNAERENDVGLALLRMGRVNESRRLQKGTETEPNGAAGYYDRGAALLQIGLAREAVVELQKAVMIDPTYVPAYSLLGSALLQVGRVEQSVTQLQNGVERDPNDVDVRFNLAKSLLQLRRADEALANFEKVLKHDPDNTEAQKDMAWVLATWPEAHIRDGSRAVELAERANQLTDRRNPLITLTLAAAYAEAGRFSEAINAAEHALQIANESGSVALAQTAREQLALYRSGKPFRDNRP